ncbi:glucoamylase family protein [Telluribacter sp. SYSU D00476]|uniref:glucoamylase family protein n=1 Tax=Telluribacter sp. SYSU D00476 TaxID=2811430 RepID=UPI001FF39071|nr:glucoamylase family protein [Telluribacter sp. SYSU D00476]
MKLLLTLSILSVSLLLPLGCKSPQTVLNQNQTDRLTSADEAFLDSLQRDTFGYFWELANPQNGLIPDRAPSPSFSSVAAVGFGLTSYLVGIERGYITRQQAAERVLNTLRFFWNAPQSPDPVNATGYKGFFYHFLDMNTGLRFKQVELSTIDTVLLLGGILSCQTYFDGENAAETEIRKLADDIYRRCDWTWFQKNHPLVSMGWHPESGFITAHWQGYNEAMLLYILALGSPTHSIQPDGWQAWTRTYEWATFYDQPHVNFEPLFGHQYSHIWVDFRNIQDSYMRQRGIDYFENSRRATLSNRAYCVANPRGWVGYGPNVWGLTACDGPRDYSLPETEELKKFMSYSARGASAQRIIDDGTIAPTAAGGSLAFAPEVCVPALRTMKYRFGNKLYDRYGFRDAFNLTYRFGPGNEEGWFDKDYLGIDQGPILLMAENLRTEFVWNLMKKNPYIRQGLIRAGFTGGWLQ